MPFALTEELVGCASAWNGQILMETAVALLASFACVVG
jgi:hypothetical protein